MPSNWINILVSILCLLSDIFLRRFILDICFEMIRLLLGYYLVSYCGLSIN